MKKNIIALCLVVSLAAVSLVFGTMAYFSDKTGKKTNAFTVGNVDITLTEHWNEEEEHSLVPTKRFPKDPTVTVADNSQPCYLFLEVTVNKYEQLIDLMGIDAYANGIEYENNTALSGDYNKTNRKGFVEQLLNDSTLRQNVLKRWFTGINYGDWTIMNAEEIKTALSTSAADENAELSVVLGYGVDSASTTTLSANDKVVFMTEYGMPAEITQDMLTAANFTADDSSKFEMTFTAYAIQTPAIENLGKAYDIIQGKILGEE